MLRPIRPRPLSERDAGALRRRRAVPALAACAALALAGCTGDSGEPTPTATSASSETPAPTTAPLVPEGLDEVLVPFYSQTINWQDCDSGQCADISAPLDWDEPDAGEIQLALKRVPASGQAEGSILINPGGPGGSGVEFVDYAVSLISPEVTERYDVVGFDPRGVGSSEAVICLDDAAKDVALSKDYDTSTPAGLAEIEADAAAYGQACLENTGRLLGNVDTQSSAKDMDLIRALVGDEQLTYLGYSYGTQLGAAYAGQFPDRVGRMVLDGGVDITLDSDSANLEQAQGFEGALRAYVEDCQGGTDCPLTGTVDEGLAQIHALVQRAFDNPLPVSSDPDRRVTQTLAFYGIAVALYDDQSWPYLTMALTQAIDSNDGQILLLLADMYNDRNADGTFSSNSGEAFRAIGCLDSRGDWDPAHMASEAAKILEVAPTLGESFTYGALGCKHWPAPVVPVDYDMAAPGAAPIVVIGTTNDPATPYEWSQSLADTLDSAVLLTWEGEGHTAYGRSNACIADAVDAYFLDGTPPAEGLVC
ncbi:MAG: alpha/beta hydrolase [Cellulomonadaceae bacterium]